MTREQIDHLDADELRVALVARMRSDRLKIASVAPRLGVSEEALRVWIRGVNVIGDSSVINAVRAWMRAGAPSPEMLAAGEDAMREVEQSARVLTESRMIPETTLNDEQIEAVRKSLADYLAARQISLHAAARSMNYKSESVISEFISGTYKGDNDKVARTANMWMERDARRREAKKDFGYVPVAVAERIRGMVAQADRCNNMLAVVAPAGVGKTKVALALRDHLRGVYVCCDDQMQPIDLIRRIAFEVSKKRPLRPHMFEWQSLVIKQIAGTNRVIFLDEAHQLKRKCLSLVRTLHDATGCPIVLLGTAAIIDMVDDRIDGRGQLNSRCMRCNVMDYAPVIGGPDGTNARLLYSVEEIKAFLKAMDIKVQSDVLDMLHAIACMSDEGTLRLVVKLCQLATIRDAASTIDSKSIKKAIVTFQGGEATDFIRKVQNIVKTIRREFPGGVASSEFTQRKVASAG